jgi:hypothetical protein
MIETRYIFAILLLLIIGSCIRIGVAVADSTDRVNEEPVPLKELYNEVKDGFSSRISLLGFGVIQQPVDSPLNLNNRLDIPRYQAEVDFRPDLKLLFRRLELSVSPRFQFLWQQWEDGIRQGDSDTDVEVFVNTWLARYRLSNELFVSYGRENLQWGPSYLLSPSNPFNRDNGRNNTKVEVPGLDYGRVVWIPNDTWTVSFIANTDEGRLELQRDFKRAYAIKLDYTGIKTYFSLIASYREDGDPRVGFFAGWTVSDALLLYSEGSVADAIDTFEVLIGGAYTLESGETFIVEFFHNEDGCLQERFDLCFAPAFGNADPADILIRKNYLLLQFIDSRISDRFNLILRGILNLDDHSSRLIGIFEYEIGDHVKLFTIGNVFTGGKDTEFGSLLKYSVMFGVEYIF